MDCRSFIDPSDLGAVQPDWGYFVIDYQMAKAADILFQGKTEM